MINPIQKTIKSWVINKFHPWFYALMIPLIVLLFIAIFRRIGEYGVTENRYFVLLIALWISGTTFYMLLSKKKRLKVMPITLCAISILSSFGFWGAFSVSKNSQVTQFKEVFQEVKSNNNIATNKQYDRLQSIIDYLAEGKSLQLLDESIGLSTFEICRDTTKGSKRKYDYMASTRLLDTLGVEIEKRDLTGIDNIEYYNYSPWDIETNTDISGFDHFSTLSFYDHGDSEKSIGPYNIYYNKNKKSLFFFTQKDSSLILELPLKEKLLNCTRYGQNLNSAPQQELTIETSNEDIRLKLVFSNLEFQIEDSTIGLNHAKAYIFLKYK